MKYNARLKQVAVPILFGRSHSMEAEKVSANVGNVWIWVLTYSFSEWMVESVFGLFLNDWSLGVQCQNL